jgi:hypothetical protein
VIKADEQAANNEGWAIFSGFAGGVIMLATICLVAFTSCLLFVVVL